MKILTCNIRYFDADDGDNNWVHRKELCVDIIKSKSADIICFQEMRVQQFKYISEALPEYSYYGMADQPTGKSPANCIFYLKDRYKLISSSGYWLSEQPNIAGSRSWKSACVRLANWVRLEDIATGIEFRVTNTHLDHVSQIARENQAKVILEDSLAYPEDYPQILTGDMNCSYTNKAIEIFKTAWTDTYQSVHNMEYTGFTIHDFLGKNFNSENPGKIDWIFTRGKVKASDSEIIMDSVDERYPSDHYFVSATVEIN